jgi:hypothetical protein
MNALRIAARSCMGVQPEFWCKQLVPSVFSDPIRLAWALIHSPAKLGFLLPLALFPPHVAHDYSVLQQAHIFNTSLARCYKNFKQCTQGPINKGRHMQNALTYVLFTGDEANLHSWS